MSFFTLLAFSSILGASSFCIGLLPLFFTFSTKSLAQLSTYGTGLLLGAAMGVIIPEGIESIYAKYLNSRDAASAHVEPPTATIAISLLCGFSSMFLIEQFLNSHRLSSPSTSSPRFTPLPTQSRAHTHPRAHDPPQTPNTPDTALGPDFDLDLELDQLEDGHGIGRNRNEGQREDRDGQHGAQSHDVTEQLGKSRVLTLGLIVHSLTDGLALGVSMLPIGSGDQIAGSHAHINGNITRASADYDHVHDAPLFPTGLSLMVFLAIVVHKAPTALALTSTLLPNLSPSRVRAHLAAFSAATPISAVFTWVALTFFGGEDLGERTGVALLFSGGTFLYVATLLTPLASSHSHGVGIVDQGTILRPAVFIAFVIAGMFTPLLISLFFGHGH
ncbi:hypothetical protein BOTBODRAFT_181274 [Botryobasidium botryosum FD-172 SS1]|uniref:Zinc/iron permease n=1 Tax=Botryobasidium botryosum (strain FD-172 SS1) TaxID=930990 RepID=A0A067M5I8_BOTB1|nr:hypothetical protein BOTBODRAFT_181274 [Botryobasidium botryosum FD-172 SS1]